MFIELFATMAIQYDSCVIKDFKEKMAIRYIDTKKTTEISLRKIDCKGSRTYSLCEIENSNVTYKVLGNCKEIVRMHNGQK